MPSRKSFWSRELKSFCSPDTSHNQFLKQKTWYVIPAAENK